MVREAVNDDGVPLGAAGFPDRYIRYLVNLTLENASLNWHLRFKTLVKRLLVEVNVNKRIVK